MTEINIDPNILQVLKDIKQEVEDMAYDKLRTVLSDFSLMGVELDGKLRQHKLFIKTKAREIVQLRLNEMKLLITEGEFWCICGKFKKPYSEIHHKRSPLVEVKNVVSPMDLIIEEATSELRIMLPKDQQEIAKYGLLNKSKKSQKLESKIEDRSSMSSSGHDEYGYEPKELLVSSLLEKNIQDKVELVKGLKVGETKNIVRNRLDGKKDKPTQLLKHKTRLTKKESIESITDESEDKVSEYSRDYDSEGMLYSRDLRGTFLTTMQKMKQGYFEYYDEDHIQEFDEENIFESGGGSYKDDQINRKVSQRDVEISLYGESFYDVLEDAEYAWIGDIINKIIDIQYVRVIADMLQEKYKELTGDKLEQECYIKTYILDSYIGEITPSEKSQDEFTEDDLEYLQNAFGNVLELALAEVTMKKPTSPISFIAQYLQFSKLGDEFGNSNREACVEIIKAEDEIEDSRRRIYRQKENLINYGMKLDKNITKLDDIYEFKNKGKVLLRRGRRIRKDIITICDTMLEKTPLYSLTRKLRRIYTFKETFKYAKTLLKNLIRETTQLKYDTTLSVYNTIVKFLKPILPEFQEVHERVFSPSLISSYSEVSNGSNQIKLITQQIRDDIEKLDTDFEDHDISESEEMDSFHDFRGEPIEYPCIKGDLRHPYRCNKDSKNACRNAKFDKIFVILSAGAKSLNKIKHIDRVEACKMCAEIQVLVKKLLDEQSQIKTHLINYITEHYITVSLESMYDEHYNYMISLKMQDMQVLEDVMMIIDQALEFEFGDDSATMKDEMYTFMLSVLRSQKAYLKKFTEIEKELAIEEFKSRLKILINVTQSDPKENPCTCKEDEAKSEQSWSDDEDGVLDIKEQKRLNRIMHRVAGTVEKLAMQEQNIYRIQYLLENFVNRAYKKIPCLSKIGHQDVNALLESIAGLFGEKKHEKSLELSTSEDGFVCPASPCVCKYILQVSALLVSLHSRMLKRSDALRKTEREQLEIEIMKMFASLVDGLTVDKILQQNLCSSNF